ncbi:MAG: PQQ-binding-like beta-propeller repeat protein [Proteobacteria bacterium]|nr:PQQ-binding-like beta-propeller repeat protein [Pseudomonadota bacterium]
MRNTLLVCALIACSTDPDVHFTQLASLPATTDGVVLWPDGETAEAAMADQVCTVDLHGGDILGDVDPSESREQLLDGDGTRSLVRAGGTLYLLPSGEAVVDGALAARLVDSGVRALLSHDGECVVTDGVTAVGIPETRCDGPVDFDVDPVSGTAWIADGHALSVLGPDGQFARRDGLRAERVRFDSASASVLITEDGNSLSRLDADGDRLWTVMMDGPILDLELSTRAGVAAVMVDEDQGGRLQIVDAESGDVVGEHPLPGTADVTLSEAGDRMALATEDEVLFYEVRSDGGALRLPQAGGAERWSGLGVAGVVAGIGFTVVLD